LLTHCWRKSFNVKGSFSLTRTPTAADNIALQLTITYPEWSVRRDKSRWFEDIKIYANWVQIAEQCMTRRWYKWEGFTFELRWTRVHTVCQNSRCWLA
jgi:hypothetical protein